MLSNLNSFEIESPKDQLHKVKRYLEGREQREASMPEALSIGLGSLCVNWNGNDHRSRRVDRSTNYDCAAGDGTSHSRKTSNKVTIKGNGCLCETHFSAEDAHSYLRDGNLKNTGIYILSVQVLLGLYLNDFVPYFTKNTMPLVS